LGIIIFILRDSASKIELKNIVWFAMFSNHKEPTTVQLAIVASLIWITIGSYYDYFSPWINGCIGFYNRKPFILMLAYTIVLSFLNILAFILSISAILKHF
jgi:hypothetical protein